MENISWKRRQWSTVFGLLVSCFLVANASCGVNSGSPSNPSSSLLLTNCVFIILMENHNWADITPAAAPYIRNSLVPMGAHAEQYFNPPGIHPSEPNYIWLEAGKNLGVTDDNDPSVNHQSTTSHLVTLLNNAGISWKAYEEDIDGTTCPFVSVNRYAPKHDPFVFFDDCH